MNSKQVKVRKLVLAIAEYRSSSVVRGLVISIAGAVTTMACVWNLVTDHSVRFNSFRTGRGFYRLPPLPIMYDSKTGKDLSVKDMENWYSEEGPDAGNESSAPPTPSAGDIWEQARTAVQNENLAAAHDLLKKYLEMTATPTFDYEAERWQRNSARDILDALSALQQGSKAKAVKEYLDARYAYAKGPTQNTEEPAGPSSADKNLQDNWEYLQAATLYSKQLKEEALEAFRKHFTKYPHSEKNEAVLYMIAKLTMESSYSFEKTDCGITGKDQRGEAIAPDKIEPIEKCQDESWHAAIKAFQHLMRTYPNGGYFNDGRGWLAFLYKRGGEQARALAEYYRLLGHPTDRNARLEAKKSLQMIGHEYDDSTLDQVEDLIAGEVNTAMAYAYHRIYNHAIDLTYQESDYSYYGEDEWQQKQEEKKRIADIHNAGNHELSRVARFATAMMERYPKAQISGGFVLRVAEAQLELQNYSEALNLARKALDLGVQGDMRTESLWIKGSAEHQRKDLKAARATFNQLIAEFPKAKLTEGARRLLAMTAEDQDDLESALDQYLALDYKYDVAYFVDVLLPTDRLAKFVNDRGDIPQHNQLLYALGVRYMRDRRWHDARGAFRHVQTKNSPPDYRGYGEDETHSFAKEPDWEWRDHQYIKASWVMQDMKTIDVLEHLEQAVDTAQGDEAKAEAMYQLASYQFDANDLLFYNPAAWQGQRYELLFQLEVSDNMRLPNEPQIIFDHSQSHETPARAIPIYLEIANRFPQTKAAKDALYTAAVAHERLSNLNPYWRGIYEEGLFAGPRMVDYADVKSIYPRYQLPRGTNGWEASTRTVNGGPGWAPKPKPLPKLTTTQKVERKLTHYVDDFSTRIKPKLDTALDEYTSYLRVCLYGLLAVVGVLAAGYLAMLGLHFRKTQPTGMNQLIAAEMHLEQLPDAASRMEKVIDDDRF